MITTIIFDFYGVFQPDSYQQWLASNGLTRTGIYQELIEKIDRGEINHNKFLEQLSVQVGRSVDYDEIYKKEKVDATVIQIVRSLKDRYKIGLLSNASITLKDKLVRLNIVQLFDEVVISSEVGIAKPDQSIYSLILKKINSTAAEAIYIDDNSEYAVTGQKVGMTAIHFKSAEQLEAQLLSIGVSTGTGDTEERDQ